ncbi:MAG: PD40 domain-containing protein [Deltaproteobacteria bacterium]|nr:PD40 domain-containing protein [Deltaproteobacteria bacterium]
MRLLAAVFFAALAIVPSLARAQSIDPRLSFRTIETDHLRIHFHTGYYELALEVAKVGEASYAVITELLGHTVGERIDIVLTDNTDDANGDATVLPYPLIHAFVTAPDDLSFLAEHQYWIYELIAHEITHIVHLDTTGNVAWLINKILGRTWIPNQYQSRWFVEGLAVEVESRISLGGRARSRLVDMVFRAEAVEDRPMRLDQAATGPLRWPQGNTWYLHGGRFLSFVAERYGHEKLKQISQWYGGTLIPYAMNRAFKKFVGKGYDEVWEEFQAALADEYAVQLAEVLDQPVRDGTALTDRGQRNYSPRYLPDGRILYFAESFSTLPQMRAVDPASKKDEKLDLITAQGHAAWPEPNGHVVFSQVEIVDTWYPFNDLFDYDVQRCRFRRLTNGLRARDPDVSRDGRFVYFIQNLGVRSRLLRAPIIDDDGDRALGPYEVIWDPGATWQMYTPRVSPDGHRVAVSVFRPPGQRDLAIINLDNLPSASGPASQESEEEAALVDWVTDDEALDGGPAWAPDGKKLYFHSARSDIYNLYSYALNDQELLQVTNTMTGVFSPDVSPDGTRIAFLRYSTKGYDIFEMPLAEAVNVPAKEQRRVDPMGVMAGALPMPATLPVEHLPSQAYNPWKSLFPRQFLPVPDADALGFVLGVSTSGEDPLGRHKWALQVGVGFESKDLNYSASYENKQLYPTLSLSTSRSIQVAPTAAKINGLNVLVVERAHKVRLEAEFPLNRALWQLQFKVGYSFEHRDRLTQFRFAPDEIAPVFPPTGNFADLNTSITFSRLRRSAGAISPEYGQRVTLSGLIRERWLGSDYRQGQLSFGVTHYQLMPWLMNHVLMLRLNGGGGYNELATRPLTSFGGLPLRDPVRDVIFGTTVAEGGVRGFLPSAFAGDFYFNGTIEYRAPLWRIEHGWSVLPIYLRTLAAAAFVDFGNAGTPAQLFRALGVGVGAELRLDIDYGFYFGTTMRFGYARGLTPGGIHNVYFILSNGF